jgi:hypothetical protein
MRSNFTYACDGAATEMLPNDTNVSGQLPFSFEPNTMLSDSFGT